MQHWDLKKKVEVTKARIIEWYEMNDGKVYISFSGGKDSTVLLDIARSIYPDLQAVYIDTGLEYPELRKFVLTIPMNNCVASYIDKVLERRCDILFMRYKDSPCRSLVTIEVANGKIVQALQKFNDPLTAEQADVVEKWNRWYENKLKSEVIKNAS